MSVVAVAEEKIAVIGKGTFPMGKMGENRHRDRKMLMCPCGGMGIQMENA